jgi:hypothetical protein
MRSLIAAHFAPSPEFPEPPRPPPPAAAEPHRQPPPCLHSGPLPLLGEHVVALSRLLGWQRRQLTGDWPCPRRPTGQGPDCYDLIISRVFRVKVQGLFVKIPI